MVCKHSHSANNMLLPSERLATEVPRQCQTKTKAARHATQHQRSGKRLKNADRQRDEGHKEHKGWINHETETQRYRNDETCETERDREAEKQRDRETRNEETKRLTDKD
jgi:hypothetical protein